MSFEPQRASGDGWINPGVPPPCGFIAATVDLAMVPSAHRNGELIADLAPECRLLGKAQVWASTGRRPRSGIASGLHRPVFETSGFRQLAVEHRAR